MIPCEWKHSKLRCQNTEGAVMSVGVKRGDSVLSVVLVCQGHVPTAMQDALSLAKSRGGRVASVALYAPERKPDPDPWVNAGVVIPESERRAMIIASQSLNMSQREFVRAAINNQVKMTDLKARNAS